MRVSALRRSLRVPPERMLRRKARSDAEPPVACGKAEKVESSDACREEARSSRVATWDADWETTGANVVESGGRKLNQSGDVGTSSLALEDEAAELLGISSRRERNSRFSASGTRFSPARWIPAARHRCLKFLPLTKTFLSFFFFFSCPLQ
jgi:hypothetical protein